MNLKTPVERLRNFETISRYIGNKSKMNQTAKSLEKYTLPCAHEFQKTTIIETVFDETRYVPKNSFLKYLFLPFNCMLHHFCFGVFLHDSMFFLIMRFAFSVPVNFGQNSSILDRKPSLNVFASPKN